MGTSGDTVLSDATDHALATIASILDQGETHREAEKPANEASRVPPAEALVSSDGEGYSKLGPGPIAALRFRWTTRRADNGEYFVDETIGENSTPIVAGPMTKDAAIQLVDERESEARHRFQQLREEMTGRVAANLAPGGEA
jgi:hypothetical protein